MSLFPDVILTRGKIVTVDSRFSIGEALAIRGETIAAVGSAADILGYARAHGRVRTRDMVRAHGASPSTLKSTFRSLVQRGLLARHGGGRSTWYSLL